MKEIIKKFDMESNELNPKSNHFFMQLMNLVLKKSLPENSYNTYLNRILQIAFNAGQLQVFIKNKKIDNEISDFVKKYKLLNLSTYINSYTQNEIDEILNQN
jgi:hypothetical protein